MKAASEHNTAQQQSRSAAEPDRTAHSTPDAMFVDHRPEAIAQRTFADAINTSPRQTAQRKAIETIHASPVMVAQRQQLHSLFGQAAQLKGRPEDEELLQGKFEVRQRQGREEEELLQGKFAPVQRVEDEELLQGKFAPVQRQGGSEEDELLQGKFAGRVEPTQFKSDRSPQENRTGMPDQLRSGIESLSGLDMSNVRVHYNSSQPAQLNALAYTQGADIHVAPGQEHHLPHEAWHVVQQAQGRVQPTMQMKDGVPVNDEAGLEHEADVMGAKAMQGGSRVEGVAESTAKSKVLQQQRRPPAGSEVSCEGLAYLPAIQRKGVKSELHSAEITFNDFIDETNEINNLRKQVSNDIYNSYKPPVMQGQDFKSNFNRGPVSPLYPNAVAKLRAQRLSHWTETAVQSANRIYSELESASTVANQLGFSNAFITMGQDTRREPDATINNTTALEVKRVSTEAQGGVDTHVRAASKQLEKRVLNVAAHNTPFTSWVARIYIDNQHNKWPYTPALLLHKIKQGTLTQQDVESTLRSRIQKYKGVYSVIRYQIHFENPDISNVLGTQDFEIIA